MHRARIAGAFLVALGLLVQPAARAQKSPAAAGVPTIDELISLKRADWFDKYIFAAPPTTTSQDGRR